MKSVRQAAMIVCFAVAAATAHHHFFPKSPSIPICDAQSIQRDEICLNSVIDSKNNPDVLWLDARSRRDWLRDGLAGSLLLTLDASESFDQQLANILPQLISSKRIIVYCSDQGCQASREVVKRLQHYGLQQDIKALHGGWQALNAAGWLPVRNQDAAAP